MKTFFTALLLLTVTTFIQAQTAGSADKSFGTGGKILDTSIYANCEAMAVQSDGKILTGGFTDTYENVMFGALYIARFNKDGSIDETFGQKGKFIISKVGDAYPVATQAIAVQPDGKIIIYGRYVTSVYYVSVCVSRLYPNGTIDSSFGNNGFVLARPGDYNDIPAGMVLQPDGKIVVTGNILDFQDEPGPDFLLRYLPDGTPDENFGNKGLVLTYYTDNNVFPGAVALQEDGKIVTGSKISGNPYNRFQAVRYNTDGSLDKSFGEQGFARSSSTRPSVIAVNAMTVQPDGKILLAGSAGGDYRFALVRFTADGVLDDGFGEWKGYTILPMDIGGGEARSVFYSAADKKIIATGHYYQTAAKQVAVVRYNDNGIVDSSFGENGVATVGFSESKHGGSDFSSGVGVLQPDGKIIVSGSFVEDNSVYNVALFRFNGDKDKQPLAIRIKRWLQHHGISWQGVQGSNNIRYYTVQRSADGIVYKDIAKVNKKVTTYEEAAALNSSSFYRIAAISWDGTRTYSNTIFIDDSQQARIFPNPVKENLQLQGLPQSGKTNVSVVDLNGNVRSSTTATGTNYSVSTANLSSGSYLLKIQHGGTATTLPFVKE